VNYTLKAYNNVLTIAAGDLVNYLCTSGKDRNVASGEVTIEPNPPAEQPLSTPEKPNDKWVYSCKDNFGGAKMCTINRTMCAEPPAGSYYASARDLRNKAAGKWCQNGSLDEGSGSPSCRGDD